MLRCPLHAFGMRCHAKDADGASISGVVAELIVLLSEDGAPDPDAMPGRVASCEARGHGALNRCAWAQAEVFPKEGGST